MKKLAADKKNLKHKFSDQDSAEINAQSSSEIKRLIKENSDLKEEVARMSNEIAITKEDGSEIDKLTEANIVQSLFILGVMSSFLV